jgi:type 1 fimbriae regulatory protein FimB/type 1 fimbriae regulatory protein FimE
MGPRDATMILVAYRHGLRASELADLRTDGLREGHPARRPQGQAGPPSTHPLLGDELRMLQRLQREQNKRKLFRSGN